MREASLSQTNAQIETEPRDPWRGVALLMLETSRSSQTWSLLVSIRFSFVTSKFLILSKKGTVQFYILCMLTDTSSHSVTSSGSAWTSCSSLSIALLFAYCYWLGCEIQLSFFWKNVHHARIYMCSRFCWRFGNQRVYTRQEKTIVTTYSINVEC